MMIRAVAFVVLVLLGVTLVSGQCSAYEGTRNWNVKRLTTNNVNGASGLNTAVTSAQPGDMIVLLDGVYTGSSKVEGISGTKENPIIICGNGNTTLSQLQITTTMPLVVTNSNYFIFTGFTIQGGKRGLVVTSSSYNTFSNITFQNTGSNCVRIQTASTNNVVQNSRIRNCGLAAVLDTEKRDSKGIYIGTASTASTVTNDNSNNNTVTLNVFGPGILSDHVDFRENTNGTRIINNYFDGTGQVYNDSLSMTHLIGARGAQGLIQDNRLFNPSEYAVKVVGNGTANDNVIYNNYASITIPDPNPLNIQFAGFWLTTVHQGNKIYCNNLADPPAIPDYGAAGVTMTCEFAPDYVEPANAPQPDPSYTTTTTTTTTTTAKPTTTTTTTGGQPADSTTAIAGTPATDTTSTTGLANTDTTTNTPVGSSSTTDASTTTTTINPTPTPTQVPSTDSSTTEGQSDASSLVPFLVFAFFGLLL